MRHGKDPRLTTHTDPTKELSYKRQFCFFEALAKVSFDPKMQVFGDFRKLSIALNYSQNKRTKATGEWAAVYHPFDAECWNDMADHMKDLRKGDLIHIKGRVKVDSWEDKETGKKRYKPIFEVTEFALISRKGDPDLENTKADEQWRQNRPSFTGDSDEPAFEPPF